MKLLVVGSGGREHAIAKKLLESKDVENVFVAPGNDGMTLDSLELVNISISEHSKLIEFAKPTILFGPSSGQMMPLLLELWMILTAGLKAFGPTKAAAELEWSKDFAKEIMVKYGVPTAAYGTFSDFEEAKLHRKAGSTYRGQGGRPSSGQGRGRRRDSRASGRSSSRDALG